MTPTQDLAVVESRTLYAIADDLQTFTETLDMLEAQMDGELTAEERVDIEAARQDVIVSRDRIGGELVHKTDASAVVLRRIGSERDYIKSERVRLKVREEACERADKWLRSYILSVMHQNGIKQLKTASNTLFIRPSDAVEITDAAKVPADYQNAEVKLPLSLWLKIVHEMAEKQKVELGEIDLKVLRVKAEPSLSTIKNAIKSGKEVPGADLKFRDNLVLR
jgi:hypothetical protein